jgi:hypothetical protein
MKGVYTLRAAIGSVTGATKLLGISTPATAKIEVLGASVTCSDEDTSEQIEIRLARSGTISGGSSATAKPTEEGSSASGCTCVDGGTAITATVDSTANAIAAGGANKLGGFFYVPLPELRATVDVSDHLVLEVLSSSVTSCTLVAEISYREI